MPSTPDIAKLEELVALIRTLFSEVQEERRKLYRERHAIYEIVLEGGHLPTLHRLADLLEQQAASRAEDGVH